MSNEVFGPTQRKVLLTMRANARNEIEIPVLFAMVSPNGIAGTVRMQQQRLGAFIARLNRKFIRMGLSERLRPGKTRNTYKLWASDTQYRNWREACK